MKILQDAIRTLTEAGIDSARLDAQLLLAHALGVSREEILLMHHVELNPLQMETFSLLLAIRAQRKPMAQILGQREFWGLDFRVTGDTLDPRADSETVIMSLLFKRPIRSKRLRMLDLGTGTGCLLLSALSEYPLASGVGVDISEEALDIARQNAVSLSLNNRVEFQKSDWNSEINGVWDVILSNPPYIPTEEIPKLLPEVARYEPNLALDGGSDGLVCYRAITRFLPTLLAEDGIALLEIGMGQAKDVAELAVSQGLRVTHIARDLGGIERCVVLERQQT